MPVHPSLKFLRAAGVALLMALNFAAMRAHADVVADITPPSVPGGLTATPVSPTQINVAWTASTDDVGVENYQVYRGGTLIATVPAVAFSDTGLAAATAYSYTVVACDVAGNCSAPSAPASATTLAAVVPGAPTIGVASGGNASASVSFTPPVSTGGAAITVYTVTSSPSGFTATGTVSPITVNGLANGTAYTFTVTATNSAGTGAASAASNSVTPVTVPGAPAIGTATAGNASASVAFTPPASNGGSAITNYTVSSSPGGLTGTGSVSPITVNGLANGTPYTFTVTATNSVGTGAASSASNSVIANQSFLLSVINNGNGTVTSTNPAGGIACGADCSEGYLSGTSVTLTATASSGYVFSAWSGCDSTSTNTCTVTMSAAKTVSATFAPPSTLALALELQFNLVGNGTTSALNVAAVFGNQDPGNQVANVTDKVDAVWHWNSTTQKWQFYTPQLTAAQSAAYATSHSFEILSSVPAGEGYWISTYAAFTLNVPWGTPFNYGSVSFGTRPHQWNLLAIGSTSTVQAFNCNVDLPPSPGQPCAANFESLWAWKATLPQKWYFYSPQLDAGVPFTNCAYAASNNFLCFDTPTLKQLGPGAGFWVYRP